jgi:hypothetical protein
VLLATAVALALEGTALTPPAARARRPTIGTASAAIATATTAITTALFKFISLLLGLELMFRNKLDHTPSQGKNSRTCGRSLTVRCENQNYSWKKFD